MFYIISTTILGLLAIAAALIGIFARKMDKNGFLWLVSFGVSLFLILVVSAITVFSSFTQVEARSIAIQTSFGRYTQTLEAGRHFIAPWSETESFETTLQPTDLNDLDGSKNSVFVTFSSPKDANDKDAKAIAGGGNGNINAIVNWSISTEKGTDGTKALWTKYRTFQRVSTELVLSRAQDTIADVANDFPAGEAAVNQTAIGKEVLDRLTVQLKPYGIVVDNVSIKRIALDAKTQASLDNIVGAQNDIRKAELNKERAAIDNATVQLQEATGALSQQANQRFCLNVVNTWSAATNGPLPATFDCSLGGSKSPVIVNQPPAPAAK